MKQNEMRAIRAFKWYGHHFGILSANVNRFPLRKLQTKLTRRSCAGLRVFFSTLKIQYSLCVYFKTNGTVLIQLLMGVFFSIAVIYNWNGSFVLATAVARREISYIRIDLMASESVNHTLSGHLLKLQWNMINNLRKKHSTQSSNFLSTTLTQSIGQWEREKKIRRK